MKRYRISNEGVSEIIEAEDNSAAESRASNWIKDGSWDGKFMADVTIQEVDDLQEDIGNSWGISVEVGDDPKPPDCREDHDHKWDSPVEVVGGIDENPGVWSTGGTTIVFKTVCRHCGVYKKETAYGSQRNPGQCDTVEYIDPDEASIEYVNSRAELLEFLTAPGEDGNLIDQLGRVPASMRRDERWRGRSDADHPVK